jgi:hypothetical protein
VHEICRQRTGHECHRHLTVPGAFTFTVQVTDKFKFTATREYTLVVT